MAKTLFLIPAALMVFLMVTGCPPHRDPILPTPEPTAIDTPSGTVALLDNMEDGDNRTSTAPGDFTGGYWYTYDDLAAPNNGDSKAWPGTENAMTKYQYPGWNACPIAVPTFQMSNPQIVGDSYCARLSGTVTTTFQYGFIGMGFDLNDGTPQTGCLM